jgi:hypothetical protein
MWIALCVISCTVFKNYKTDRMLIDFLEVYEYSMIIFVLHVCVCVFTLMASKQIGESSYSLG